MAASTSIEDEVVEEIQQAYDRLPAKYKPAVEAGGVSNWVPLSGIVLVDEKETIIRVVAVATGMKCLPSTSISALNGIALHDSHAEILAIRLFNHFLLQECHQLATDAAYSSPYLTRRRISDSPVTSRLSPPFTIHPQWRIYQYCSECPCGDSSMELIMSQQPDATPWSHPTQLSTPTISSPSLPIADVQTHPPELLGRGYFSALGAVRRKPARGDSPPTLSKSCSDKLALKQCTSLLSSVTSLLIAPENAYLHAIIVPESQVVDEACERAFGRTGRMEGVVGRRWEGGFAYRPFEIRKTGREFRYSRRAAEAQVSAREDEGSSGKAVWKGGPSSKPSNIAAAWNPYGSEVIINGILQGRKKGDVRGASMTSRRRMAELLISTTVRLEENGTAVASLQTASSYSGLKASPELAERRKVKAEMIRSALRGWIPNEKDHFELADGSREGAA